MKKVWLISPGKLKEKYLRDAAAEYEKRLSRYCDLTVCEPEPAYLPEHPSQAQITAALEKEAAILCKMIPDGAFCIALCVEGKPMSSEQFAARLGTLDARGCPVAFVIGSSYGLSETVKKRADLRLSVSEMTFPHQLFRVMLLEQLYRAYRINEGGTYHK